MINLPQTYLNNMKELLQDDYDKYLESFNHAPMNSLRVNTSKISVEDFLKIAPFKLKQVEWCENGFNYSEEDKPSKHPYYFAGLYYLQEASAMLPASLVKIKENDHVLDICAAPGGKSTEILNKLNHTGLLISNDISISRSYALLKNLELSGNSNFIITSENTTKLKEHFPHYFDKIFIDAPCSGEGMFRKDPSLIKSWLEKGPEYYVDIQKEIIRDSLKMLKDDGEIVYSTCTFNKKEDEEMVEYFLSLADMKVLDQQKILPFQKQGEGQFVSYLLKKGIKEERLIINQKSDLLPNIVLDFLKNIKKDFKDGFFKIINDNVYFINNLDFKIDGLRIVRSGLLLGEIKKTRFEPSTALALCLKMEEFNNVLNLKINDERVLRYLKGETIKDSNIKNGYVLICVDSYPLGFGKNEDGTIKNKYEKGWLYR